MRMIDADALISELNDSHFPGAPYVDAGISIAIGKVLDAPTIEPETYKEKLKEIADALSEKFAYMNTCLNERDIILGYLDVKRYCETHCNTDCTNTKCESHPSFVQPEITLEQAIERLHELGWMQEHDPILTESTQLVWNDWNEMLVICENCGHAIWVKRLQGGNEV